MKISFIVNEVFNGWEPTDTRLGGTEESVVEWAEELSKRGHTVFVFHNGNKQARYNGTDVIWCKRESFFYDDGNADIFLNIKSPEVNGTDRHMAGKIMPIKPMFYFTNETNATVLDLSSFEGVIWPSQWAKDNIPVNNDKVYVVPHGFDPTKIYPEKKIPKQCFYASSPDRGLNTLLEAWPKVITAHPDATLLLTYGVTGINLPGVTCLGDVDENTMNEIFRTSEIWCHPASGGELFCITGLKAQAAGCVPVIIPTMALSETVKWGQFSTKETYALDLIMALHNGPDTQIIRKSLSKEYFPTWKDSTDKLLEIIEKVVH